MTKFGWQSLAVWLAALAVVLFLATGKYSDCKKSNSDFWWAFQHVTGNQCWSLMKEIPSR